MKVCRAGGATSIALVGVVALSASAAATPPEGDVERTDLAKGDTTSAVSITSADGQPTTLLVQQLVMHPGSSSGWHTHPGPEHSVITTGTVELQTAGDCAVVPYGAGQSVFIPAGVAHRVANGTPHDAGVVATYTVPAGAPVRADSPDVCGK